MNIDSHEQLMLSINKIIYNNFIYIVNRVNVIILFIIFGSIIGLILAYIYPLKYESRAYFDFTQIQQVNKILTEPTQKKNPNLMAFGDAQNFAFNVNQQRLINILRKQDPLKMENNAQVESKASTNRGLSPAIIEVSVKSQSSELANFVLNNIIENVLAEFENDIQVSSGQLDKMIVDYSDILRRTRKNESEARSAHASQVYINGGATVELDIEYAIINIKILKEIIKSAKLIINLESQAIASNYAIRLIIFIGVIFLGFITGVIYLVTSKNLLKK